MAEKESCKFCKVVSATKEHEKNCSCKPIGSWCKYCKKYVAGCTNTHKAVCPKKPVQCPHGCGAKPHQKNLNVACHYAVCPNLQVPCPNEGCGVLMMRKQLRAHAAKCPKACIKCDDCEASMNKDEFRQHATSCPKALVGECGEKQKGVEKKIDGVSREGEEGKGEKREGEERKKGERNGEKNKEEDKGEREEGEEREGEEGKKNEDRSRAEGNLEEVGVYKGKNKVLEIGLEKREKTGTKLKENGTELKNLKPASLKREGCPLSCGATMCLAQLELHLRIECPNSFVACPRECNLLLMRNKLKQHLEICTKPGVATDTTSGFVINSPRQWNKPVVACPKALVGECGEKQKGVEKKIDGVSREGEEGKGEKREGEERKGERNGEKNKEEDKGEREEGEGREEEEGNKETEKNEDRAEGNLEEVGVYKGKNKVLEIGLEKREKTGTKLKENGTELKNLKPASLKREGCPLSCGATMCLAQLELHLRIECPNSFVACPRKCNLLLMRNKLKQHLEICTKPGVATDTTSGFVINSPRQWNKPVVACPKSCKSSTLLHDHLTRVATTVRRPPQQKKTQQQKKTRPEVVDVDYCLLVSCPNEGCTRCLRRINLQSHLDICPKAYIPCPRACGLKIKREEISIHLFETCLQSDFTSCPHDGCNIRIRKKRLQRHITRCPEKFISCPNKCGVMVKRKYVDKHSIETCLSPPFVTVGHIPRARI